MVKKSVNKKIDRNTNSLATLLNDPELFFGIVGPIGVDIDSVVENIKSELSNVGYTSETIHLTQLLDHPRLITKVDSSSYFSRYRSLIARGNEFRRIAREKSAIAALGIAKIRQVRKSMTGSMKTPRFKQAFIIRQFKRPEEIELMRKVYGRKFIQISVSGSETDRRRVLIEKISAYDDSPKDESACEKQAIDLISLDQNQKDDDDGQRISDVFHLGDAFVDGVNKEKIKDTIQRFVRTLFGDNGISPTKDEYGLYTATAASFRSLDLSRQVGAAVFSENGEIISLGCNEVPKAGGGTYWSDDQPPRFRDIELGHDPNHSRKNEIVYDFLNRMFDAGLLSQSLSKISDGQKRVDALMSNRRMKDSQLMDIIEYGRIIHAEMSAISDAARLGRKTKGAVLYSTTFPCHLCAKHIVAAGMDRVVFLEPYPKSYAQKLHPDAITFEPSETGKVLFEPFVGISPRRYRDLFEKRKRKGENGKSKEWYHGRPVPMIEDRGSGYIEYEEEAVFFGTKEIVRSAMTKPSNNNRR